MAINDENSIQPETSTADIMKNNNSLILSDDHHRSFMSERKALNIPVDVPPEQQSVLEFNKSRDVVHPGTKMARSQCDK